MKLEELIKLHKDHPRIRGEHPMKDLMISFASGSSPHSRGTQYVPSLQARACGIIPAFAGNTFIPLKTNHVHKDHPRIRGEH